MRAAIARTSARLDDSGVDDPCWRAPYPVAKVLVPTGLTYLLYFLSLIVEQHNQTCSLIAQFFRHRCDVDKACIDNAHGATRGIDRRLVAALERSQVADVDRPQVATGDHRRPQTVIR